MVMAVFLKYVMNQNAQLTTKNDAQNAWQMQMIQNNTTAREASTVVQAKMVETIQKLADGIAAIDRKLP